MWRSPRLRSGLSKLTKDARFVAQTLANTSRWSSMNCRRRSCRVDNEGGRERAARWVSEARGDLQRGRSGLRGNSIETRGGAVGSPFVGGAVGVVADCFSALLAGARVDAWNRWEIRDGEIRGRSATGLIFRGSFAGCSRRRLVRDLSEAVVQHADAPTGWPADRCERAGISPDINPGAERGERGERGTMHGVAGLSAGRWRRACTPKSFSMR